MPSTPTTISNSVAAPRTRRGCALIQRDTTAPCHRRTGSSTHLQEAPQSPALRSCDARCFGHLHAANSLAEPQKMAGLLAHPRNPNGHRPPGQSRAADRPRSRNKISRRANFAEHITPVGCMGPPDVNRAALPAGSTAGAAALARFGAASGCLQEPWSPNGPQSRPLLQFRHRGLQSENGLTWHFSKTKTNDQ